MQEAFEMRMGPFVSHSLERQRYIRLRSQERHLQQLAADERRRLFGNVPPQCSAVSLSEPAVGMPSFACMFNCALFIEWYKTDMLQSDGLVLSINEIHHKHT